MRNTNTLKKLHQAALKAQKNSHSPYSKKRIGAALLTASGKIFSGCNVENSSYGGTVCAERVAIFKMVSELGSAKSKIKEILVISPGQTAWPPCGFCRQVLTEFADQNTLIHLATAKKIQKTYTLKELMPAAFDKDYL